MQLSHYIVGRKVQVYSNPISKTQPEGTAVIKKIIRTPEEIGVEGQYRVSLMFSGDSTRYERFVNVGDVFGI